MNGKLLRIEGLVVFILAISYYYINGFSWLLFFIFLLTPDVGMVGYSLNPKTGAIIYNLFHTYTFPLLLIILAIFMKQETILLIGLIWSAHIGMDRALGYGLKNPTSFKDTHLSAL